MNGSAGSEETITQLLAREAADFSKFLDREFSGRQGDMMIMRARA
jgi:hypothetical protein